MASQTLASTPDAGKELVCTNANTWYQLYSGSNPCKCIEICAPSSVSPLGRANAGNVYWAPGTPIYNNTTGLITGFAAPATGAGAKVLPLTATGINYIEWADAGMVWFRADNAGDAVEYVVCH